MANRGECRNDNHAFDHLSNETLDHRVLFGDIVVRERQNQTIAPGLDAAINLFGQFSEEWIADIGDNQTDRARPSGSEVAGDRIGRVAEVVRRLEYAFSRPCIDTRSVVEDKRSGGFGNASAVSYIFQFDHGESSVPQQSVLVTFPPVCGARVYT
tara:strand:+ start:718 stop:1182 length:465 start_codon:yes stop_codon:yes gene_type:complete